MRKIDLRTAISEIRQAREGTGDEKSPFFIIAGAGISAPIVPLASKIAQDCKERAIKQGRTGDPHSNSPMEVYSYWFGQAFPQKIQRTRYLQELILSKPISHANFRLAHLLSEKRLATLVVTTNFDDFLSRALSLFGQAYTVCDHPDTAERVDTESSEIQIVHVHGNYWFYNGCNLSGEIEARTEDTRERSVTMMSRLDDIFSRHSPIVIGYAGWEHDVIMTALKRRLKSSLPNNLYWFCYRRSDSDPLMSFFQDHDDVCLVLPDAPVSPSSAKTKPVSKAKATSGSITPGPVLSAKFVLDQLVAHFTQKAPALTEDPIGFFAGQLADCFPPDPPDDAGEDIYRLRDVIDKVKQVWEIGGK